MLLAMTGLRAAAFFIKLRKFTGQRLRLAGPICSSQFAGLTHYLEPRSIFMKRNSLFFASVLILLLTSLFVPSASAQTACGPAWKIGISITTGEVLSFNGDNWQAIQPETQTVDGWQPPNVPALWKDLGPCNPGGNACSAAPGAPSGLSSANVSSSGATLSWTAVAPPANCTITSYTVFENGASLGSTSNTSFPVTGLAAGTTFNFTVAATDSFATEARAHLLR